MWQATNKAPACCRSEPNAAATENAVAALGRVLAYSAGTLPDQGAQLAELWLHALPLTEDKQEAEGQHALLVDFLDRSDARWGTLSLLNVVPMLVLGLAVGLSWAQPDVPVQSVWLGAAVPSVSDDVWPDCHARGCQEPGGLLEAPP